jgi:hypothetical protein
MVAKSHRDPRKQQAVGPSSTKTTSPIWESSGRAGKRAIGASKYSTSLGVETMMEWFIDWDRLVRERCQCPAGGDIPTGNLSERDDANLTENRQTDGPCRATRGHSGSVAGPVQIG